jgi:hypothetical protein
MYEQSLLYRVETLTGIKFITWKWAIFVKNPETGRFLFFLAHILTHMVFAYLLPEVRNHPQLFFFKWKGMSSDSSFERSLRKEYNSLFVS